MLFFFVTPLWALRRGVRKGVEKNVQYPYLILRRWVRNKAREEEKKNVSSNTEISSHEAWQGFERGVFVQLR